MLNSKISLIPDFMKSTIICIDSYERKLLCGRLYCQAAGTEEKFNNVMQMLIYIDSAMDDICFPEEYTKIKSFASGKEKRSECKCELEPMEVAAGKMATFKLKVIFRQNASWQGIISWLDGTREQSFRSVYEMLMLMDSALEQA